MCCRKVGVIPIKKSSGPKNFYICSVFWRLRDLVASICWTKRDIDNRSRALESMKGLLRCREISWTLVHKRLKTGPEFLPTLTILFCPSLPHTLCEALTNFSDWLIDIVSAAYSPPFNKVWLSSVCWSPSAKPGNEVQCGIYGGWVTTTVQFEAVCGTKFMSFWDNVADPL